MRLLNGERTSAWQKQITDPSGRDSDTDHVLYGVQVLGALAVAVILCQVCRRETVLILDTQVHAIHHEDLTALKGKSGLVTT